MRRSLRPPLVIIFLAVSIGLLACLPCQTSSQLAPRPERTVPVSTQEAQALISALGQGVVADSQGRFVLTITEEQLTSYVALNMSESIVEPQVLLTDGQIQIYGTFVSPIEAPVAAVATLHVDETGPHVAVESVSVGGFALPETFVAAFARQIDDLFAAVERHEHVEIGEIEIREGKLIVRGTVNS